MWNVGFGYVMFCFFVSAMFAYTNSAVCGGWADENPLLPLQLQSSSFFIINCITFQNGDHATNSIPFHLPSLIQLASYYAIISVVPLDTHSIHSLAICMWCEHFHPKYNKWIIIFRIFIKYFIYFLSLIYFFFVSSCFCFLHGCSGIINYLYRFLWWWWWLLCGSTG